MTDAVLVKALSAYVDEDYDTATNLIQKALKEKEEAELYDKLAVINLAEKKHIDAVRNEEKAVELGKDKPQYLVRKGIAHFHLQQYAEAQKCFESATALVKSGSELSPKLKDIAKTWARKCEAELDEEDEDSDSDEEKDADNQDPASRAKALKGVISPGGDIGGPDPENLPNQTQISSAYKHEYYQSADYVIVSVRAKHCDPESVTVQFGDKFFRVEIESETGKTEYKRAFHLYSMINPDESFYKVMSTKIEIKLKKMHKDHWMELEKPLLKEEEGKLKSAYSSKKDWNQVEKYIDQHEELFDKPEGDEAMNKLFTEIYGKASEETRRAMNKSFQESGGTVLSTNWDEVSKTDYLKDRTAPDGMEWRTWEGDKIPMKEKKYGKDRDA